MFGRPGPGARRRGPGAPWFSICLGPGPGARSTPGFTPGSPGLPPTHTRDPAQFLHCSELAPAASRPPVPIFARTIWALPMSGISLRGGCSHTLAGLPERTRMAMARTALLLLSTAYLNRLGRSSFAASLSSGALREQASYYVSSLPDAVPTAFRHLPTSGRFHNI